MCQITGDPLLSFIVTIVFWEVVLRFSPCQDAETLQSHICQAEQRLTEKSPLSLFLMKPFLRGVCLRIHVVIALGYIFSPVGEALLKTLETRALSKSGASEESLWAVFYAGSACGCLLWLFLSGGIPPNLLMASSQLMNMLFFVLVPALPQEFFDSAVVSLTYLGLCGLQSTSRMLFIIWNFNEDFHGGFQVAARRIGVLESLRSGVSWIAVTLSYAGHDSKTPCSPMFYKFSGWDEEMPHHIILFPNIRQDLRKIYTKPAFPVA